MSDDINVPQFMQLQVDNAIPTPDSINQSVEDHAELPFLIDDQASSSNGSQLQDLDVNIEEESHRIIEKIHTLRSQHISSIIHGSLGSSSDVIDTIRNEHKKLISLKKPATIIVPSSLPSGHDCVRHIYDENDICFDACVVEMLGPRQAAAVLNIPYSTLVHHKSMHDKIDDYGSLTHKNLCGRKLVVSPDLEQAFANYIDSIIKSGVQLSRELFRSLAQQHIGPKYPQLLFSDKWISDFLHRHNLHIRTIHVKELGQGGWKEQEELYQRTLHNFYSIRVLCTIHVLMNFDESHMGILLFGKLTLNVDGFTPYVTDRIATHLGATLNLLTGTNNQQCWVFPCQMILKGIRQRFIKVYR